MVVHFSQDDFFMNARKTMMKIAYTSAIGKVANLRLFTIAAICLQWRVPFIYNRPYNNVKIFHAIWFNAMKKYFDLRRGKKSKYKEKSAFNCSYLWKSLISFQSNEAPLKDGLFADTGHYLKVTK